MHVNNEKDLQNLINIARAHMKQRPNPRHVSTTKCTGTATIKEKGEKLPYQPAMEDDQLLF
jgi:hypothetical protein